MESRSKRIWRIKKKVDNLTFLKVYGAGHMVPMDQPEAALEVLNYLIGLK